MNQLPFIYVNTLSNHYSMLRLLLCCCCCNGDVVDVAEDGPSMAVAHTTRAQHQPLLRMRRPWSSLTRPWQVRTELSSSLCLSGATTTTTSKQKNIKICVAEERDQRTGRELTFNCFHLDLCWQVSPMQMLSSMCRILLDDCKSFHYA